MKSPFLCFCVYVVFRKAYPGSAKMRNPIVSFANRLIISNVFLLLVWHTAFAAVDAGWPRVYQEGAKKLILYQPQVDEWKDYQQISFRSAFSLTQSAAEKPIYGVIEVNAPTTVDSENRTVLIEKFVLEVRIANVPDAEAKQLEQIVRSLLPQHKSLEVSLDRVLAYMNPAKSVQQSVELNLDPPPIFYSESPAILVNFIGEPQFKPVAGTNLMYAVNTNWDVFLDQDNSTYYLLDDAYWLSSSDPVKEAWRPVLKLPEGFLKLPQDENWNDVRAKIPGSMADVLPKVFVSTEPAELILTEGEPAYSPIRGTRLMAVSNTESPVFFYSPEKQYYYLVAGRWFRAEKLSGPWTSATRNLPADFGRIPDDYRLAYVLASVPGTDEAADAALLASIPQTTTIKRDEAKLEVSFDGEPKFEAIPSTSVQYAVNTPTDVFLVQNKYYACFQGVWFVSSQPTGPWVLADAVPQAIYSIPASSPKHYVTYVKVYNSSPTTVTTGYTGGYSGQYISAGTGLLMFGAGIALGSMMSNDYHHDYYYYPPPPVHYSYGCAAHYDYAHGGYYRSAAAYGPYGGAGRSAYYNPSTGTFARSAARVGPAGAGVARQAYNPFTNTYAARAAGVTPYGAASRGYVARGDEWAQGGQRANANGRVGWAETSKGGQAVAYNKRGPGGQGGAVRTESGDIYAGRNGSVYKRDSDGGWSQRTGDSWSQAERPKPSARQPAKQSVNRQQTAQAKQGQYAQSRASAQNSFQQQKATRSSFDRSNSRSQLDYDSYARSRGNQLSSRSSTSQYANRSSGAARSGSRGSRGGGGRRR
jgi:hypothetical protein